MHYRDRLYLYCKVAHLGRLELTTSRRRASTLPLSCRKPKLKVALGISIQASRAMQTGHLATKCYPIFVKKFKKVVFCLGKFFMQLFSHKICRGNCTAPVLLPTNMQHKTDNNYEGLAGWPHREPFCIQVRHKSSRKRIMSTLFLLLCTYPMVI